MDYNKPLILPTQRKWHIFFCDDLDRQIRNWEVVGSIAEQNTGKYHAITNNVARICGNLLEAAAEMATMNELCFQLAPFISNEI